MLPSKEVMRPFQHNLLYLCLLILFGASFWASNTYGDASPKLIPYEERRHCGPGNHRLPEHVSVHGMHSKLLNKQLCYLIVMPEAGFHPGRNYRTLVLLHGLGGTPMDWINAARFHESAQKLMAEGKVQPFVTIIPAGENGYWSDWADGKNPYAKLVVKEYLQAAADLFPLLEGPEHRAIAGISMGGFGALSIALSNPDVFGFVAAMSPTDLELALRSTPRRKLYLDVVGRNSKEAGLERVNPWHLVQAGRGAQQTFALLYGSREAEKFSVGTRRLHKALLKWKRDVHLYEVPRAIHSWTTWSGVNQDWWLERLSAFWPVDSSPSGAAGKTGSKSDSGQP